jgi:hypothetical protein
MSKLKTLRDISVTVLALGTAYGLGVLSCVYFEAKLLAECVQASKKDDSCRE